MTGYQSKKAAALDEEGMYLVHHTQPTQEPRTMEREALKLALDVLQFKGNLWHMDCKRNEAIASIKEALAQPAQKPWVGLSDEEIGKQTILAGFNPEWKIEIGMVFSIVRNLEAKLKEKQWK